MLYLIPAPLHRIGLRLAYRIRHRWRSLIGMPLAGVMIIARDDAGNVLLVRHSYGTEAWSLPGGGAGRNEDPQQAARREFREELGCELYDLKLFRQIDEVLSGAPHRASIFTARVDGHPRVDGRELLEARFFPAAQFPENIARRARSWLDAYLHETEIANGDSG